MPIYEYVCGERQKYLLFTFPGSPRKLIPIADPARAKTFAVCFPGFLHRGEERCLEGLPDLSKLSDLYENDLTSTERALRKMGKELGDEFGSSLDKAMTNSQAGLTSGEGL